MKDFTKLRKEFPLLEKRLYLTSHCLGPLPRRALVYLEEYKKSLELGSRAVDEWIDRFEDAHQWVEMLLSAPAHSVALGANATHCQSLLAASLSPSPTRNIILTTELDFRSSLYLWKAQEKRGFQVKQIKVGEESTSFSQEKLLSSITEEVSIVAVSMVSFYRGTMLNIASLVDAAKRVGALVIVDAYQAVGIVPIDVSTLGVDALVGGTHKWLHGGGPGLAFLYVRPELSTRLSPAYPGWIGHKEMKSFSSDFSPNTGTRRFEQGTPPIEPLYTSRAGFDLALEYGIGSFREKSLELTGYLLKKAKSYGLSITTPNDPEHRGGMLCFDVANPEEVVTKLAKVGIDVDTRPGAGLRVSPHPCTTEEECEHFLQTLRKLVDM